MSQGKNFFQRALDAVIEGRTREAQRYVERFQRDHQRARDGLTKR
jgi:hypothetical protein